MDPLDALFEWLLDGAPGASNAPQVVERIAADTRAGGIQLEALIKQAESRMYDDKEEHYRRRGIPHG